MLCDIMLCNMSYVAIWVFIRCLGMEDNIMDELRFKWYHADAMYDHDMLFHCMFLILRKRWRTRPWMRYVTAMFRSGVE
jgi:hypothetical protein